MKLLDRGTYHLDFLCITTSAGGDLKYIVALSAKNVISDFLERTEEDFMAAPTTLGVFWEALFLPDGTQIRTKYFGEFKVASIEKESIVWDGNVYPSFAKLANKMRGDTMNNAWKELQIKRPSDKMWMPAQSLRR